MNDDDDLESSGSLDHALRAGFGGYRRGSVIGCLEDRTGSMLRLSLPDAGDDLLPVVKPAVTPDMGTRYQVLGEIARGGLGVVLKGRDLDLGRDVAVKVLHERFREDRQVIERFVEEAQIGGQLQHPGIVPVHELGLAEDGRPFFAMKLVKGETLAAMLHRRRSPGADLQRFLRVFLQVCQTVAYAHARRVVHRDLKPSNVLVGAYGEVQVVDWGLAKVLRGGGAADEGRTRSAVPVSVIETVRSAEGSSHSLAGSVMGTPSYMPPEQARGEVESMDARSDVFALGAVLCEILTGRPPYDAGQPARALREAAECRMEPVLRRLEESGADVDLLELTRSCLAPSPDARPLDAAEVARRVEDHLQSAEDRARAAEVRAAELRVRTRSSLALAGVILIAVVLTAGAYLSWADQRRTRQAETAARVEEAITEATRSMGQAEQAGLAGIELWQAALGAVCRAQDLIAAGDADGALEGRVAALAREVAQGEARTRLEAMQEKSHAVLIDRLREVRVGPDVTRLDIFQGPERRERESGRRAAEYATLFSSVGVDEETAPDVVAGLFDCVHRIDFALALDAWAEARRVAALFVAEPDPESWRRPVRMARRLDPEDPWRNALRDEFVRAELDPPALRALAIPEVVRERGPEEIALVVDLLDATGELEAAVEAQMQGMVVHPSDYWLNVSLRDLCAEEELTGRLHDDEATWAMRVAQALRPDSRFVRFQMAVQRFDENGEETLLELAREEPGDPLPPAMSFFNLMQRGRFEKAAGMLPGVLPALRSAGIDWDYAPFLWDLGYGEQLLETPGLPPLHRGVLHLKGGRDEEAWAILSQHREELRPSWPFLFLPAVLRDVESAEDLRATFEHLRGLRAADEVTLRATPSTDLLAATDVCDPLSRALLFRQAFESDPTSKELGELARARQIAAFMAAAASGMNTQVQEGVPELTPELRAELRQLALEWMNEELDVIERDLASPDLTREQATVYSRNFNQMAYYGWLAPIREEAYLAEMPPDLAHACRLLWARIAGLEAMLVRLSTAW